MTHPPTTTRTDHRPGTRDADTARMELLESLPVRLQQTDFDAVLSLSENGKTPKSIGWRLSLDTLVIELELSRHALQRPLTREQQQLADEEAAMPRLDRLEMNRLARGTHVPNVQLRQMIADALDCNPDLSVHAILCNAGYKSTSHGRRQLGYMHGSGTPRFTQTIRPDDAARLVRALGREPVEVVGL